MVKAKKKGNTIDDLARMVASGFFDIEKRFDKRFTGLEDRLGLVESRLDRVENRLDGVENNLAHVNARLDTIEHDIQKIMNTIVERDEFEDLTGRVKYFEIKMGIESGK